MTCAILPKLEDPIRFHENLINAFLLRDAYKTWKNFSPLKLEDLSKQGTVSLGYPNIKEEQKRVVTIFFSRKDGHSPCGRRPCSSRFVVSLLHHRAGVNHSTCHGHKSGILSRPDPSSLREELAAPD